MNAPQTDIMIVGAGGKVAAACIHLFLQETDWNLALLSAREIAQASDYPDRAQVIQCGATEVNDVRQIALKVRPRIIINAAAMTNVDGCESDKQLANTLNVKAVENLARVCKVIDAHLIHFSTDYIFNGQKGPYAEADLPDPINYYGKTKLGGENAILSSSISSTIIRTNIVYGKAPGVKTDFVTWVREKCIAGERITIADDQFGNPTACDDLALAVMRVIEKGRRGIYHVAGADYLDRYDFAKRIAAFFSLSDENIVPVKTTELSLAAKRPLRAGLITLKAETELGIKPTSIAHGLEVYRDLGNTNRHLPKARV